jgi:hypothetical protein
MKQNRGLRKRRKTAVEVKKEDRDNDADMLADNEMDGDDDDWRSDTVKEGSDSEYDEWKRFEMSVPTWDKILPVIAEDGKANMFTVAVNLHVLK